MYTPLDTIYSLEQDIQRSVSMALDEDIGTGDITAQLIPADKQANAYVITRENCIVCGRPWVDETFKQLDPKVKITWLVEEGEAVSSNTRLFELEGSARSILTGERTALNYLQLLSGVATKANHYAKLVDGTAIKILDTRKTIPGLRLAQKYAVKVGGCENHRIGLYDAFLIKENHIAACGGIEAAVKKARKIKPDAIVEVEVETLAELEQAQKAGADVIMLDNFGEVDIKSAAEQKQGNVKYELSGNLDDAKIREQQYDGIDFMSSGGLTKHNLAVDLSLRLS